MPTGIYDRTKSKKRTLVTHCKHGHEFTPENTCIRSNGNRHCKTCSRKSVLKRKYGITPKEYDEMLRKQDGRCAICREQPGKRRFAVDHNHRTGRLRGLLCDDCNTSIGKLGDDYAAISRAQTYLVKEAWREILAA